jgi:hypothetical protein
LSGECWGKLRWEGQELLESSPSYVTIKRLFECFVFSPPVEDGSSSLDLDSDSEGISDDLENPAKAQVIENMIDIVKDK